MDNLGESIFDKYDLVEVDESITIPSKPEKGLTIVVGGSGTGKSTILRKWGMVDDRNLCEATPIYKMFASEEVAEKFLIAAGLRSIPCWKRTLPEVSNGERHRAEVALELSRGGLFIDEFSSLVDRDTARALCCSLNKLNLDITVATCHSDILEWLNHDNVYSTDSCQWLDRGSLRHDRQFELTITPCDTQAVWDIFKKHHYLSGAINKSANSWVATHDGRVVAMTSIIAFPSGNWSNGWRGHRTVVLPEFQGMGDWHCTIRYYCRTYRIDRWSVLFEDFSPSYGAAQGEF
jgi:hypothetical protein